MNPYQLCELIIKPAITAGWGSCSKQELVIMCMIAAHESKLGEYQRQIATYESGRPVFGPARGLYGMEPKTLGTIIAHYDRVFDAYKNVFGGGLLDSYVDADRLMWDMRFATWAARAYLKMDKNPLPYVPNCISSTESKEQLYVTARYLKKYWNAGGAASEKRYVNDFFSTCGDLIESGYFDE